jgi:hypothetical protein
MGWREGAEGGAGRKGEKGRGGRQGKGTHIGELMLELRGGFLLDLAWDAGGGGVGDALT